MFENILLSLCIFVSVAIVLYLVWDKHVSIVIREKPGKYIPCDQLAPPACVEAIAIPLEARCRNSECDFEHPLAAPPRPHDLISWGSRVPISFRETEWPICPKCGQLALMCMTMTWIEMKECRPVEKGSV